MCFAKRRKSSNCIVDTVQMNFFAAIDHGLIKTVLILFSLQGFTAMSVCLGILISIVSDGVRTWITLGSWSGSEWGTKPAQTTGHFKYPTEKKMYWIKELF